MDTQPLVCVAQRRASRLIVISAALVGAAFVSSLSAQVTIAGNQTLETSGTIGGGFSTASVTVSSANATLRATGALALQGYVTVAPGSLTIDTNGYTITVGQNAGANSLYTNTASITKTGAGTLSLAGSIQGSFSATGGNVITSKVGNSASVSLTGATLTTSNIVDGAITLNAGATLKAGAAFTSTTSVGLTSLSLAATDAAFDTNGFDVTYAQQVNGAGALNKLGAGTLTLSGTNTFSGSVAVNGGTLKLGSSGALPSGKSLSISSGATLNLNGMAASLAKLEGAGNVTLGSATLTVSQAADATFSGAISGTGGLTKSGAGNLTLSGTNGYTGATAISAGTLTVNGSLANTAVTVASGATLGGSGTIGGLATFASGSHLAPGNSAGTLTFTNGLTLVGGAILDFQLGTSSDLVAVTGGLLTGPSSGLITLNLSNSGGFGAGTFTLINYGTASGTSSFDLGDFVLGSTIAGYTYDLGFAGSSLQLTASAIPEPSTYAALAGLGALALAFWRRRFACARR